MSLVSNFIGNISASQFGNTNNVSNKFDMNDKTFSDILDQKLMEPQETEQQGIDINSLGIPAGISIEDFNEDQNIIKNIDKIHEDNNITNPFEEINKQDHTTSEIATFFTSLLDENSAKDSNSQVFDFVQKQAKNFYNKYSRNVITDMSEFVEDIKSFI